MAIYHCSTKPLARSSGRSAVAAAAYRSGDCLIDARQGLEHDYTRCSGVLHTELVLPEGAGEWSRAELWNAAEKAEKRKDARTDGARVGSRAAGRAGGHRAAGAGGAVRRRPS